MPIYLKFEEVDLVKELDGKTFQVHIRGPNEMVLYPVTFEPFNSGVLSRITDELMQCPAILHGTGTRERCGKKAGHEGNHCWANGD